MTKVTRREFLEDSLLAATAAMAVPAVGLAQDVKSTGPNNTLRIACIGVRGRGTVHARTFAKLKNVQVAAICDVDPRVIKNAMQAAEQGSGKKPTYTKDIRKLLEDKTIDAVSIATPNHWHSLAAIWAVQAGKHAYVEKPISHNVWEGGKLAEAAKKHNRVVAHGTQSRSRQNYRDAMAFLHAGKLGKIKVARGLCYKRRKSIGTKADAPVPEGVAYDLWLGPAPKRPFNPNRFHYEWHWNWSYGNGDIGNQGVHQMDVLRWGLNKNELPKSVVCVGGRFGYEDDGETANTQIGLMDFGDVEAIFEVRGLPTGGFPKRTTIGNVFHCADGYLVIGNVMAAAFTLDGEEIRQFGGGSDTNHFQNFIDAARRGKPEDLNADARDGYLSSALCHLPNISHRLGSPQSFAKEDPFGKSDAGNETFGRFRDHLKKNGIDLDKTKYTLGRSLTMDPKAEKFTGEGADDANRLLTREYRKPFAVPERI